MTPLLLQMLEGTVTSLQIFFLTLLFSLPLGFVVAKGKMTSIRPVRWITDLYIQIMRGTPLILQLIFFYFAPFYLLGLSYDRFTACIVAFVVNYSAYFAEIYRTGLQAVPRGQWEAGKVLGFSRHHAGQGHGPCTDYRGERALPCGADRLKPGVLHRSDLHRGTFLLRDELYRQQTLRPGGEKAGLLQMRREE